MNEPTATWTPAGGAFWAGRWHHPDASLEVLDPEDGQLVGRVGDCTAADVDEAVHAVAQAVLAGPRGRSGSA